MTKVLKALLVITASTFLLADLASAAGYSKKQCQQMEREYRMLQQKEKQGKATAADKRRMSEIDGINNVYCD